MAADRVQQAAGLARETGLLRRPTILPAPAFAVRLVFGEMGQELLLASTRVVPRRLEATGFAFELGQLEAALRAILRRPGV